MADCREQVYSNEYFDFIIPYGVEAEIPATTGCVQRITEDFDIFYYPREGLPPLDISTYTYTGIPKCYGLLDVTALEASGILRLQNQPVLSLKGNGVLVGFIDTGIDYTNPVFRFSDGSTRIAAIWDQSIEDGTPPDGIIYGAEYRREQINEALQSEDPYELVPHRDENGHGTFLAGVACGSEDIANDFIGAVPQSQIAVVKLKQAKPYLRDFFFIPEGVEAFSEADIMMGVSYLDGLANRLGLPLVICLAVGNSMGSHGRDGSLATYLNYICTRRRRSVVTAAGNEANARHHFQGTISGEMEYEDVEINVETDVAGVFFELWAESLELYAVSIISPTGEQFPRLPVRAGGSGDYHFIFEGTTVSVDYRVETKEAANQLIYFRFSNLRRGLWIVRVFPENIVTGRYNMWLPLQQFTEGNVFFLRSDPDITITTPGTSGQVITVGGYQVSNGSIYQSSGRGFTTSGEIKPDFAAPAVSVYGPGLRGNYVTMTGTSAAAAITTGAVAQIMQWALVEQREPTLSNAGIKNMLIRGTRKNQERSYPNREWGYGTLDVYRAFELLR